MTNGSFIISPVLGQTIIPFSYPKVIPNPHQVGLSDTKICGTPTLFLFPELQGSGRRDNLFL